MIKIAKKIVVCIALSIFVWFLSATIYVYRNADIGMKLARQARPYSQTGSGGRRIAIFGDSSVYGTGVKDASNTLAGLIGKGCPDCAVVNYAQNGVKIQSLNTALPTSAEPTYDLSVVSVGYNDVLHFYVDLEKSCNFFQEFINKITAKSEQTIVFTMPSAQNSRFYPVPLNYYYGMRSRKLNKCIRSIGAKEDQPVQVVDLEKIYTKEQQLQHESNDSLHFDEQGSLFWHEQLIQLHSKSYLMPSE